MTNPLKLIGTFTGEDKGDQPVTPVSAQCILDGGYSATNGDLSVIAKKLVVHSDSPIDLDLSTWKQANLK